MTSVASFASFSRVLVTFLATGLIVPAHAEVLSSLVFDLNSLVWMLVGALAWAVVLFLWGKRPIRRVELPKIVTPGPVSGNSAVNPVASGKSKDSRGGENDENLSEYLTSLDETTTVTVEEVSDIAEQVDLFLLLGRHEVAINMLLSRIREENENDPRLWFKLLDIYHARGDRTSFEKLANDIRVRFNVALPTWEDRTLQAEGRHGLEHFPHLLEKITDCWGTSTGLGYLQSLIKDNRSGARAGFNEDAFREVMFLISILEQGGR